MTIYQIGILGHSEGNEPETLVTTLTKMVGEFGITLGKDFDLVDAASLESRDKRSAFAAVYFGSNPQTDVEEARTLSLTNIPIIPTVSATGDFGVLLPPFLQKYNGLKLDNNDPELYGLAAALL